jgi:D-amino-acid dehydrogenase
VAGLWVNAGHGTLGWTHGAGSGKAMAELISGKMPRMNFNFYGFDPRERAHDAEHELSLTA